MERLFIRIVDGAPFEHPLIESNFVENNPDIDIDNLPEGWMEFERVAPPTLDPYQVGWQTTYQIIDGKVKDVHEVIELTGAEREAKVEEYREEIVAYKASCLELADSHLADDTHTAEELAEWQSWRDHIDSIDVANATDPMALPFTLDPISEAERVAFLAEQAENNA